MTTVSSDQLRDIAVAVVEGFLNDKIPLSTGLAKEASAARLNSDQIQRGVEAVNTISYLKILGMSDDRTVEFPLAKFAEVMSLVCLPDSREKQAETSQQSFIAEPQVEVNPMTGSTFTPNVIVDENDVARKHQEKIAFFIKEAAINEQALSELRDRNVVIAQKLVKLAKVIAGDTEGLDKLASVADAEDFGQLSVLVTGSVQPRRDFGGHAIFKEAGLKDAHALADLYKEAKRIVAESAHRETLQKRAHVVTADMIKQAGLISGIGNAAGRVAGAPVAAAGKVIASPFKEGARVAGNAIGGAKAKMTGEAFTPKKMGLGTKLGLGAVGMAASVGVDAMMYNPGKDAATGRSNDVWDALQRD